MAYPGAICTNWGFLSKIRQMATVLVQNAGTMPFDFALDHPAQDSRKLSGLSNYLDGLSAENSVANYYVQCGAIVLHRRWRGRAGEIDLVARDETGFIFVEVKKARTHSDAAQHLSRAQLTRICASADDYLGTHGHSLMSNVRIDLATVDGTGQIETVPNISLF